MSKHAFTRQYRGKATVRFKTLAKRERRVIALRRQIQETETPQVIHVVVSHRLPREY